MRTCYACNGNGTCSHCKEIVSVFKAVNTMVATKDFNNAEVKLQNLLKHISSEIEEESKVGFWAGTVGGAILGSIFLPGVGTVLGTFLGGRAGQDYGNSSRTQFNKPFQADILYALGQVYQLTNKQSEARQAFMKALTLKEDHSKAQLALRKLL